MKTQLVCVVELFYRSIIIHSALCDVLCAIDTATTFIVEAPSSWATIRQWMTSRDGGVGVSKMLRPALKHWQNPR